MIHVLVDIDETMLSVGEGINAKTSSVMFKKVFGVDGHEEMIDNVGKTEMGIIQEVLEKVSIKKTPEQESTIAQIPEEAYQVWAQAMSQEFQEHPVRVLSGMVEFLTALSKNPNVKLGLLTGNSPERAEAKLKSGNLDGFFRDPNTGQLNGVFGNMAPKRDQLFDIIKQQTTPEDKFVIIDDSIIGAKMAQTHNIPIIMVATGRAAEEELKPFTSHVFPDFGDNRWQEATLLVEAMVK